MRSSSGCFCTEESLSFNITTVTSQVMMLLFILSFVVPEQIDTSVPLVPGPYAIASDCGSKEYRLNMIGLHALS